MHWMFMELIFFNFCTLIFPHKDKTILEKSVTIMFYYTRPQLISEHLCGEEN